MTAHYTKNKRVSGILHRLVFRIDKAVQKQDYRMYSLLHAIPAKKVYKKLYSFHRIKHVFITYVIMDRHLTGV